MEVALALEILCSCGARLPAKSVVQEATPGVSVPSACLRVVVQACPRCTCRRARSPEAEHALRRAYEEGFENGMATFQGAEVA